MQLSAFIIFGEPDFLPTTAQLLCRTPHLRLKMPVFRLQQTVGQTIHNSAQKRNF